MNRHEERSGLLQLTYRNPGDGGAQIWYSRSLPAGPDRLIAKVGAGPGPQSWSKCPTIAASSGAVDFGEVP